VGKSRSRCQGNRALPELVEAGGVAGHGGFAVIADLAIKGGAFADQVAAVADQELQGGPEKRGETKAKQIENTLQQEFPDAIEWLEYQANELHRPFDQIVKNRRAGANSR
jgi:hypothetical protein